jgi:hypothetical protein
VLTTIINDDEEMPPEVDLASDDEASETLKALEPLKKPTSPTEVVTKAEMVPIVNALEYLVRSMAAATRSGNYSRMSESEQGRNYNWQQNQFISPNSIMGRGLSSLHHDLSILQKEFFILYSLL